MDRGSRLLLALARFRPRTVLTGAHQVPGGEPRRSDPVRQDHLVAAAGRARDAAGAARRPRRTFSVIRIVCVVGFRAVAMNAAGSVGKCIHQIPRVSYRRGEQVITDLRLPVRRRISTAIRCHIVLTESRGLSIRISVRESPLAEIRLSAHIVPANSIRVVQPHPGTLDLC